MTDLTPCPHWEEGNDVDRATWEECSRRCPLDKGVCGTCPAVAMTCPECACDLCGSPHVPSWADRKFGCPGPDGKRRMVCRPKFERALRVTHEYRADLARFPGDPQAKVDGPRALAKLIDQRKREGWILGKPGDFSSALNTRELPSNKALAEEAFKRAKARGFRSSDDAA